MYVFDLQCWHSHENFEHGRRLDRRFEFSRQTLYYAVARCVAVNDIKSSGTRVHLS